MFVALKSGDEFFFTFDSIHVSPNPPLRKTASGASIGRIGWFSTVAHPELYFDIEQIVGILHSLGVTMGYGDGSNGVHEDVMQAYEDHKQNMRSFYDQCISNPLWNPESKYESWSRLFEEDSYLYSEIIKAAIDNDCLIPRDGSVLASDVFTRVVDWTKTGAYNWGKPEAGQVPAVHQCVENFDFENLLGAIKIMAHKDPTEIPGLCISQLLGRSAESGRPFSYSSVVAAQTDLDQMEMNPVFNTMNNRWSGKTGMPDSTMWPDYFDQLLPAGSVCLAVPRELDKRKGWPEGPRDVDQSVKG